MWSVDYSASSSDGKVSVSGLTGEISVWSDPLSVPGDDVGAATEGYASVHDADH